MTPNVSPQRQDPAAGLIRGYASLFDRTDLAGDRVLPGAFLASIARRGAAGVRMLWQHDPARPIGVWTSLAETRTGLFVEGRLALGSEGGREAFALLREGALDGLSIGFRTRIARPAGRGGAPARRLLAEIDLWEISLVTFPMQERARVLEHRAEAGPIATDHLARRLLSGAQRLAASTPKRLSDQPAAKETTCRNSS